jgi:hypothetical protein
VEVDWLGAILHACMAEMVASSLSVTCVYEIMGVRKRNTR